MNLVQAEREAYRLIQSGQAVMLSSPSGIGKSQTIYRMFEKIKARDAAKGISWGFGVIFGATQNPADIIGYLYKGEREVNVNGEVRKITVTDPSAPLWYISTEGKPAFMYDRFFLFIDEYGQTEGDTKRALAEIFLNGGTSPWYLPPGSVRVAATNKGVRYGVSKDFDFCIARRTLLEIDGDIDVLLTHLDKPYDHQGTQWQTMPVIKAWAATNPQIVFEPEPKEQGAWCNPRQLCSVDRYLQVTFQEQGNQEVDATSISTIAGTVGMPAAQSIVNHLQFRLELPSYDDIRTDPVGTPVPTRADLQMLMAYELAAYTQKADLSACITYIQRLEKVAKDMGVTYISALLRRDYMSFFNEPAMSAWINKNAALISVISSLSN